MPKPSPRMTSLDASLGPTDAESEITKAFEEEERDTAASTREASVAAEAPRAVFSGALKTLLVSTTCHKR